MAAIGSITVNTMTGYPTPAAMDHDAYARPGSDTVYRRDLGKRPTPATIDTISFISGLTETLGDDAADAVNARYALKGTAVTVTDAHGVEHELTFIAEVIVHSVKLVRYLSADAIEIRTRWTVEGA